MTALSKYHQGSTIQVKSLQIPLKNESKTWADRYVKNFERLNNSQKASVYFMIDLFYSRLQRIDEFQPFFDRLHSNLDLTWHFPPFIKKGINFWVMGGKDKITDIEGYDEYAGKTVEDIFGYPGDLRDFSSIQGDGSHRSVVFVGKDQSDFAKGYFNLFYHEFAHFLHYTLLTEEEFYRLAELYTLRKSQNHFLDSYAATHVSEYFAQGFEAYLAHRKYPNQAKRYYPGIEKEVYQFYRHTRQSLKDFDPELYEFIEGLIDRSTASFQALEK